MADPDPLSRLLAEVAATATGRPTSQDRNVDLGDQLLFTLGVHPPAGRRREAAADLGDLADAVLDAARTARPDPAVVAARFPDHGPAGTRMAANLGYRGPTADYRAWLTSLAASVIDVLAADGHI